MAIYSATRDMSTSAAVSPLLGLGPRAYTTSTVPSAIYRSTSSYLTKCIDRALSPARSPLRAVRGVSFGVGGRKPAGDVRGEDEVGQVLFNVYQHGRRLVGFPDCVEQKSARRVRGRRRRGGETDPSIAAFRNRRRVRVGFPAGTEARIQRSAYAGGGCICLSLIHI